MMLPHLNARKWDGLSPYLRSLVLSVAVASALLLPPTRDLAGFECLRGRAAIAQACNEGGVDVLTFGIVNNADEET